MRVLSYVAVALLTIVSLAGAAPDEKLQYNTPYTAEQLNGQITNFLGFSTASTKSKFEVSLAGKNIELWTAVESCGFRACQYFIVEPTTVKKKSQFRVLGQFFGTYKILQASSNGFHHIEVTHDLAGEEIKYVLKYKDGSYGK